MLEEAIMKIEERDRSFFELGKGFLLGKKEKGITQEVLNNYLSGADCPRLNSINAIYRRLLESAQSANMKSGVIGKAIGGVDKLGSVLFDFNVIRVFEAYSDGNAILDKIEKTLSPRGKVRRGPRCIWPRYCDTILGAASFLRMFASAGEFYAWCDRFVRDSRTRLALPLLLAKEIPGFGFALACEFLKEIGYMEFGKPDVHLKDIFKGVGICPENASDYDVLKTIIRVADNSQVTPFSVDKVFWLIGSGYFYGHKATIGKEGRIGSMKKEFIQYACKKLRALSSLKKKPVHAGKSDH